MYISKSCYFKNKLKQINIKQNITRVPKMLKIQTMINVNNNSFCKAYVLWYFAQLTQSNRKKCETLYAFIIISKHISCMFYF
jgi:hypothetical protein